MHVIFSERKREPSRYIEEERSLLVIVMMMVIDVDDGNGLDKIIF